MFGVSYCAHCKKEDSNQTIPKFLNRDVDGAIKIQARFLAQFCGYELGPWAMNVQKEDVEQVLLVCVRAFFLEAPQFRGVMCE